CSGLLHRGSSIPQWAGTPRHGRTARRIRIAPVAPLVWRSRSSSGLEVPGQVLLDHVGEVEFLRPVVVAVVAAERAQGCDRVFPFQDPAGVIDLLACVAELLERLAQDGP